MLNEPPPADPISPYEALPNGANMRVAIRRTLRVGDLSGTPVEDLGVRPDSTHKMTRKDLLEGNADLLDAAGAELAAMPNRRLTVSTSLTGGTLTVDLETEGLDRVDLYLDDRPISSEDLAGAPISIDIVDVTAGQLLRADGYDGGELAACRRTTV